MVEALLPSPTYTHSNESIAASERAMHMHNSVHPKYCLLSILIIQVVECSVGGSWPPGDPRPAGICPEASDLRHTPRHDNKVATSTDNCQLPSPR